MRLELQRKGDSEGSNFCEEEGRVNSDRLELDHEFPVFHQLLSVANSGPTSKIKVVKNFFPKLLLRPQL
jgi:hypothetical protein